ncbi:MAG: flippase-like domain-containing protein, partial [FCB group bacterium]|nr:flippase-like domain-containing protein [FCB group bacterium]
MKKIISLLLKLAITGLLFWWLIEQVDGKELLRFYNSIPKGIILAVLGLGMMDIICQGFRYVYAARLLMPPFTLRQAVISHFSGFTFRLMLPASLGEVGKTFLLPGTTKQRIFTFMIDIFYATGIMFFFFGISTWLLYPHMWYMLAFCFIYLVLFWIYRLFKENTAFKHYVPEHVPYLKIAAVNISLTILSYTAYISQFWLLLRPYAISWFTQAKISFFILGVGAIPFSFAGIGFREGAAHVALRPFGVPAEVAVGTTLLIFFINVILPAMVGVLLLNFLSPIK